MPKIIDDAREKILTSAKKKLLEGGYADLSMREIADECRMAVGTIYNYFPGKMQLVASIMAQDWELTQEKMDEAVDKSTDIKEGLLLVCESIREFAGIYRNVWQGYGHESSARVMIESRHPILRDQISSRVSKLMMKYGYESELELATVLAEVVLSAAVWPKMDMNDLKLLSGRLFQ